MSRTTFPEISSCDACSLSASRLFPPPDLTKQDGTEFIVMTYGILFRSVVLFPAIRNSSTPDSDPEQTVSPGAKTVHNPEQHERARLILTCFSANASNAPPFHSGTNSRMREPA